MNSTHPTSPLRLDPLPEGEVPLLRIQGPARECGAMLGWAWQADLKLVAQRRPVTTRPWWLQRDFAPLLEHYAPYLPELYEGMSHASGVPLERIASKLPEAADAEGCTSFALAPQVTAWGVSISGQTKDTPPDRAMQFQVLAMRIDGGPSLLTLTYPGWLFGHGFVRGGCAIFRNALYAGTPRGRLPFAVWGLLAMHCQTAQQAVALAEQWGIDEPRGGLHCTIADEQGGILGLEAGASGLAVLEAQEGIYVHANGVCSDSRLRTDESDTGDFQGNSAHRCARLAARFQPDRGRLTPQLAYAAMMDHAGAPHAVCRHDLPRSMTTASVVAEPAAGRLHVTRGPACSNWPTTYSLD